MQTAQFREAAEKAAAAPHAAAVEPDRHAKQMEGIADNVVARAEFVLARQERQRAAMNELLIKLKEETAAFELMLEAQRSMRSLSTVAGLRVMTRAPFARLVDPRPPGDGSTG